MSRRREDACHILNVSHHDLQQRKSYQSREETERNPWVDLREAWFFPVMAVASLADYSALTALDKLNQSCYMDVAGQFRFGEFLSEFCHVVFLA